MKTRQQMNELGYAPDPAPAVMYFLTARLGDKDIADMRKQIPRKIWWKPGGIWRTTPKTWRSGW